MFRITLFVIFCFVSSTLSLFQIPLQKIEPFKHRLIRENVWGKYKVDRERARGSSDAFAGSVMDYETSGYIGKITVGTPQQEFRVVMDSGTSNFFIPDIQCGTQHSLCGRQSENIACYGSYCQIGANTTMSCSSQRKFDDSKSTSYTPFGKAFSFSYDADTVNGFLGVDTVRFGAESENQLVIPGTIVAQAVCYPRFLEGKDIDGIMGLGFQGGAQQGITSPFLNAFRKNLVDNVYHVYLEKGPGQGGLITYGGRDTVNCAPVNEYHPVTTYASFTIYLTSVYAGDFIANKGYTALSDTANSYIMGPAAAVAGIAKAVGANWDSHNEVYWIPCQPKTLVVYFTVGGTIYPVHAENLIIPYPSGGGEVCIFTLLPFKNNGFGPSWILGDPFNRQYCALYDLGNQWIGFSDNLN